MNCPLSSRQGAVHFFTARFFHTNDWLKTKRAQEDSSNAHFVMGFAALAASKHDTLGERPLCFK